MFERVRGLLLRALRVPAEPTPPRGARDARVFRASERYYRYKLLRWALSQAATLFGLVAGILTVRSVPGLPHFLLSLEAIAVASFLLQLPFTYAALRLDFELRWYIVTDRSLRIREGLTTIREQTMTFANIQNIEVRQGPLQRLLGIADVEVRSAGGGAKASGESTRDTHVGLFRGVDDAFETHAGFVNRTGIASARAFNRLTWYGRRGALVETVQGQLMLNRYWRHDQLFSESPLEGGSSVSTEMRPRTLSSWPG